MHRPLCTSVHQSYSSMYGHLWILDCTFESYLPPVFESRVVCLPSFPPKDFEEGLSEFSRWNKYWFQSRSKIVDNSCAAPPRHTQLQALRNSNNDALSLGSWKPLSTAIRAFNPNSNNNKVAAHFLLFVFIIQSPRLINKRLPSHHVHITCVRCT